MPRRVRIGVKLHFKVTDRDGRVVREWEEEGHSFTQNFATLLFLMFAQVAETLYDTAGSAVSVNGSSYGTASLSASPSDTSYGIIFGSGTGSNSVTLYNLYAPLTSSSFSYSSVSFPEAPTVSGSQVSFKVSRSMTNNSGSTVNVTEIGVIARLGGFNMSYLSTGASVSADNFLIIYDQPSSPISLENGQTLTVTYTITLNA
ncbi:hypothetical protein [Acidilobus sp.]|uniref:hypothetical protein n=1 Tax=Acidilobus sp. TaxID=1872109 RepID=UPI003CFF722B